MTDIDSRQRTAARVAGIAYLVSLPFYAVAFFGLRGNVYDAANIGDSLIRIAAIETQFRVSIAFDLIYCIGISVLLSALFVILESVNRHLAILAALLWVIFIASSTLMALSLHTIIGLVGDPASLEGLTLQQLVRSAYSSTGYQYSVGMAFWGVSTAVFSWLWLKSRFIPSILAIFGIVSSVWCAFCFLAYITYPTFGDVVNPWWFDTAMGLFYIALSLWLIVKGLSHASLSTATQGRAQA